jgi:hypothetical protein
MMEFVSWDHYCQLNGKIKTVPNHQPDDYNNLIIKDIIQTHITIIGFILAFIYRIPVFGSSNSKGVGNP